MEPMGVGLMYGVQRLPDEPIGSIFLTLTGIKSGSEASVFNQNGDLLATNELTSGDVVFQLPVYASGSANNNVRIFISSLQYENIDIQFSLRRENSTIPFFQRIDRTYKNPT